MTRCIKCGSFAINHNFHGRDGTDGDLCDVCYWRKRAKPQVVKQLTDEQIDKLWAKDGIEMPQFIIRRGVARAAIAEFCRTYQIFLEK